MSWTLASILILGVALVAGFAWWERSHPPSRLIALVATLAALAALGRIAFAPIPNVKPTTDIVLFAGFALGAAPGFAVGATAALTSNVFFGQGPWTPWQMAAWGLVGLFGALLGHVLRDRPINRWTLAAACGFASLGFGAIMDLHLWTQFSDHSLRAYGVIAGTSLGFNVAHIVGSVIFCLAFGPAFLRGLQRFQGRLSVRWVPAYAAAALVPLLLLAVPAAPPAVAASTKKPVSYLTSAQNADGGFGAQKGASSNPLQTSWVALGLIAAGRHPGDVARGGDSVMDYLQSKASTISDGGEINRTILILGATGQNPRSFGGKDLVGMVLAKQQADGSFEGRVNTTAFALLALKAAGVKGKAIQNGVRYIRRNQNPDGGFNFAGRGAPSGIDDTSAPLQALVAAGQSGKAVSRARTFLLKQQKADGGFPLNPGAPSNAQSTAWAIQGLAAAGRNPDTVRRNGSKSAIAYLRSLTAGDGSVRYSRTSTQTPVWVTSQAVTALAGQPFPLDPVARRPKAAAPAATAAPVAEPDETPKPKAKRNRQPDASGEPLGVAQPSVAREPDPVTLDRAGAIALQAGVAAGTAAAFF